MAFRPPRGVPTRANQEAPFVSLTLDLIRLQADSLFEGLEKGVFGSVVNLYLFIVVGRLLCSRAEPVVVHFSGNRGRSPQQMTWTPRPSRQLRNSFQVGAVHCADLVTDDHTGNELLPHPFRRPLCLATIGRSCCRSGPGRPWFASFWPGDGLG